MAKIIINLNFVVVQCFSFFPLSSNFNGVWVLLLVGVISVILLSYNDVVGRCDSGGSGRKLSKLEHEAGKRSLLNKRWWWWLHWVQAEDGGQVGGEVHAHVDWVVMDDHVGGPSGLLASWRDRLTWWAPCPLSPGDEEGNIRFCPPEGGEGGVARVEDVEGGDVRDGNGVSWEIIISLPVLNNFSIISG